MLLAFATHCASAADASLSPSVYLLTGNKTDSCIEHPTKSERVECLQRLFESYYGFSMDTYCPQFAHWIVENQCDGCPWSRVNSSAITPSIARTLSRTQLFQAAQQNCKVAEYFMLLARTDFDKWPYFAFFGIALPLFSATSLLIADRHGTPSTPRLLGNPVPEPLFCFVVSIAFFVGTCCSASAQEYMWFCDTYYSHYAFLIADWINAAILFWNFLWRFRRLEAHGCAFELKSWNSFLAADVYHSKPWWVRRAVDAVCYGPLVVIIAFAVMYRVPEKSVADVSFCEHGAYSSLSFGLIQYSKLALVILANVIYAIGPSQISREFYLRYGALTLVFCLSSALLFLMKTQVYSYNEVSMLIPHVLDAHITGPMHAEYIAYTLSVCAMGLAEPLRIGWPGSSKRCTEHPKH